MCAYCAVCLTVRGSAVACRAARRHLSLLTLSVSRNVSVCALGVGGCARARVLAHVCVCNPLWQPWERSARANPCVFWIISLNVRVVVGLPARS